MLIVLLFFTLLCDVYNGENMNGKYVVASGDRQNVNFNTDYASKGNEYFDVWAPEIASRYGDVFWTDQGILKLPDDIVLRFAGKVIAITGYEQDQVMVQPPGEPGVNPDLDKSVPINWAYNHHYMAWMTGNYSTLKREPTTPEDMWYYHGAEYKWIPEDKPGAALRSDPSIPTSQFISEGNGGESRKSFHGYPDGYAQLIESPETWHITPMQIDTRNRECGAGYNDTSNCTQFMPGIEPIQARYGRGVPLAGTNYSGLLECPCNSKFGGDPMWYGDNTQTKIVTHNYVTAQTQECDKGETITNSVECFDTVSNMAFLSNTKVINKTVSDTSIPTGCSINEQKDSNGNDIVTVYFNSLSDSKGECSISNRMTGDTESSVSVKLSLSIDTTAGNITFLHSPKGEWCSDNHINVFAKYPAQSNSQQDQINALNKCENYCKTNKNCNVCSVDCSVNNPNLGNCQWVALPVCGTINHYNGPNGLISGDISWKQAGMVNITISGPSDVWFGVGFNARDMADQPYALITNSTNVWEQKIGTCGTEADHCPGITLNKTIELISNIVNGNIRTVLIQRSLIGAGPDYYSFVPNQQATINLITAVGQSQVFAYHAAHGNTEISLIMSTGNTCICDLGANGKICQSDGTECTTFVKNCIAAAPAGSSSTTVDGSLLMQDNPTCNSRQYSGGLRCCRNGHNLLDVNQTIPDELLRYHMKFRFWFQEYFPANSSNPNPSHYNLPRIYQQTEANAGEYDIPPAFALPGLPVVGYPNWPINKPTPGTMCTGTCPNGADCECQHTIHYRWIESASKPMRLIYAGGHCHAPSCISLILHRNDTGEILCSQIPQYGTGNVNKDKYDEAGYILIPPCLWGNDIGLNPSVLLPAGTPLLSITKKRNTNIGHYGEMASWQMRGVFF